MSDDLEFDRITLGSLNQIAAAHPRPNPRVVDAASELVDIEVTEEFQQALDCVRSCRHPFIFITGRAGTGKTTFLRWLKSKEEQRGRNVAIVAPTGLAALTAGGQTIHSFFRFPPQPIDLDGIEQVRHRAVYEHLDLLIIDEVSMVRVDLMDGIEKFLRLNGPAKGQTFGGVPVVAVGDLFQLPPVVDDRELQRFLNDNYDSPYFFSAKSIHQLQAATIELTKVFRQPDENFLLLLNGIRQGHDCEQAIGELNDRCLEPNFDDPDWIILVPTRKRAASINERRLSELPGEPTEFVGQVTGKFLSGNKGPGDLTEDQLDKQLPSPYRLRLKVGAKVLFVKNDRDHRWVNGTQGTVREIRENSVMVEVTDKDLRLIHEVHRDSWERLRYEYDPTQQMLMAERIGCYIQFPLAPAWAITIHKSQGQTLDRVVVDLHDGAFTEGQTYVALSRCRSIDRLRLRRPIRRGDVMWDERIRRLYGALCIEPSEPPPSTSTTSNRSR